jgi:hypothetical protein
MDFLPLDLPLEVSSVDYESKQALGPKNPSTGNNAKLRRSLRIRERTFQFLELPRELQLEIFEYFWPIQTVDVPSTWDDRAQAKRRLHTWSRGLNTTCGEVRELANRWLFHNKIVRGTLAASDRFRKINTLKFWNNFFTSFHNVQITLIIDIASLECWDLHDVVHYLLIDLILVLRRFSRHTTQLDLVITAARPEIVSVIRQWDISHTYGIAKAIRSLAAISNVTIKSKLPKCCRHDCHFHELPAWTEIYDKERQRLQRVEDGGTAMATESKGATSIAAGQ